MYHYTTSVPDRFFLLPPGKTWGNLPFTTFNLTDEDFYLGESEPAPKGPDELIIDFELITVPYGSNVSTSDVTMVHLYGTSTATNYRVLPSSDFAMVVDVETTQWKAVNRTAPEYQHDLLLTMLTAPNVSVVMRPDVAGTYQMLITVVDACNSTAQAVTNVTVLCSHAPVPRLKNGTSGEQPWRQKEAMAEVSETHSLGWWPAHALDATPTVLENTDEQYYYAYRAAYEMKLMGATGVSAAEAAADRAAAAADAAAQGLTTVIAGAPPSQFGTPASPPPPTYRPLASFQEWTQWTTAPAWDAPFRESDGLLYGWKLVDAPHGSNAWRRLFAGVNEAGRPVRFSPEGYPFLHSVAPEAGSTPFVNDPRNYVAAFQPDVVGTYDFELDVSNLCFSSNLKFSVSFVCNAVPEPSLAATPREVGLCLARQDVASTTTDADGDDVHVLWTQAPMSATTRTFPDGTYLGARNASYGMLLSDHTGPTTSFMPDVQGTYALRLTATDGCLITAKVGGCTSVLFYYKKELFCYQM